MNFEQGLDNAAGTNAPDCNDDNQDLESDEVVCINQQTNSEGDFVDGEEINASPHANDVVSGMEMETVDENEYENKSIKEEVPEEYYEEPEEYYEELEVNGAFQSASQGEKFNEDEEFNYTEGGNENHSDYSHDEHEDYLRTASGPIKDPVPVCSPQKINLSALPSAYSKLAERGSSITISPCFDSASSPAKRKVDHTPAQNPSSSYDTLNKGNDIESTLKLKGVTVTKAVKRPNVESQVQSIPSQSVPEPKPDCEISPVPFKKPKLRKNMAPKPPEASKVRTYNVTLFNDSHTKVEGTVTEKLPSKRGRKRKTLVAELPLEALLPGIGLDICADYQTLNPALEIEGTVLDPSDFPTQPQFPNFMFDNKEVNIIRRPYDEVSSQTVQAPKRKRGRPPKGEGKKGAGKKGVQVDSDDSADLMATLSNNVEAIVGNFQEEKLNIEPTSIKPLPKQTLYPGEKNEAVSIINRNSKSSTLSRPLNNTSECETFIVPQQVKKSQPFKPPENRMVGDVFISPIVSDAGMAKLKSQKMKEELNEFNSNPPKDSSQTLKSYQSNIQMERNEVIPSRNKSDKVLNTTSKSESAQLIPAKPTNKITTNRKIGDVCISPVVVSSSDAKKSLKPREEINELSTDSLKDSSQSVSPFPSTFQKNSQIEIIRKPKIEPSKEVPSPKKTPVADSPKRTSLPSSHVAKESKPDCTNIKSHIESSSQKLNVDAPSNEISSKSVPSTFDKGLDVAKPKSTSPTLGLFQGSKSISFHKITPQTKVIPDKQRRASILPETKSASQEGKHELMITRISKTPSTPQPTKIEEPLEDPSVEIIEPQLDLSIYSSVDPIYSSDEESSSSFFKGFLDHEVTQLSKVRNEYYNMCVYEVMKQYQRASPPRGKLQDNHFWSDDSKSSFGDDFCEVSPITKSELKRTNTDSLMDRSVVFLGFTPTEGVSKVKILPSANSRFSTRADISRRQLSFSPGSPQFEPASTKKVTNPNQNSVNLNLLQEKYFEVSIVRKNQEPAPSLGELHDDEYVEDESGVLSLPVNDVEESIDESIRESSLKVLPETHLKNDYESLSSKFQNSSQVTLTRKSTSKVTEKSFVTIKCFKLRLVPFKSVLSKRNSKPLDTAETLGTFKYGNSKHIIYSTSESSMKDKFVVSGSQLSNESLKSMCTFVKMFHWGWINNFDESVTHLVCGGSYHTQKFLKAVANKSLIVTIEWVEDCIRERELLNPINYLVSGRGPRSCLLSLRRPLFQCYAVWLSPLMKYNYSEFIKILFTKLGGCLMDLLSYEEDVEKLKFFLYYDEQDVSNETLGELFKNGIWPVKCTWVTDSVRWFRIVPVRDYLHPSFSTVTPSDFYNGCECGKDPLGSGVCTCANNYSNQSMSVDEQEEYMYNNSDDDVIVLDSD